MAGRISAYIVQNATTAASAMTALRQRFFLRRRLVYAVTSCRASIVISPTL